MKQHQKIRKYFGKSLKLRQISAGGCNGCELELSASGNVNFDMGRFGIDFVASPRHADGIVITGPLTNMTMAIRHLLRSSSESKIIILFVLVRLVEEYLKTLIHYKENSWKRTKLIFYLIVTTSINIH
jgi:hypothetical protein